MVGLELGGLEIGAVLSFVVSGQDACPRKLEKAQPSAKNALKQKKTVGLPLVPAMLMPERSAPAYPTGGCP